MSLRHRLPALLLVVAFVAGLGLTTAAWQDGVNPATAPLSARIPVDPSIAKGTFENGLTYYVRANRKPENRAELRLVVNAGSVLEEDDQRGLAHFVEHMAFNGTTNFPKMAIVEFMESIGMRFGPSVNAFTSFDETVYQLRIPTDRPEVIDRALLILEDWAHRVTFDPVEVDKERGVIMEEWRLRRGAGARLQEKQFPVLLADSRYAVRLPIGTVEVLQNFTQDRLKQFYADWYRPDLMAVIAIGDFDPAEMEQRIRRHFAPLPAAAARKPRPAYTVPDRPGTAYTIATDPELTGTQVSVYNTAPAPDESTVGSYRDRIVVGLFTGMLNARFAEIARKPDAPFLQAGASRGSLVRTTEATTLSAVVRENEVERGLAAMFEEAERVARFGFTATELDRQKRNVQRSIERLVEDRDNHDSAALAAEYSRNYLTTEPIPGIVYEAGLYERFLPEITLAEINALAKDWSPNRNRVVLVSAPEREDVTVPTEAQLAAVMNGVAEKTLTAYEDTVAEHPLMAAKPAPGRIVATNTREALGITEWTLSNGVRVMLKPTDFRQDEIVFRAFSPGGHSLAGDEDYIPASTASQIVGAGGLGQLNALDLRKVLAGKVANVRASIGQHEEGLSGSGSRQDLDTLFQLIYLTFTEPRADAEIFKVMTEQTRVALQNQTVLPEYAFTRALNDALTQSHPRARLLVPEDVDRMSLERSLAFYRERFADASDFTFVFVGSFEPEMLRPFVEQYLAALPSLDRVERVRDFGITPAPGVLTRRVEKGIEPKSQTRIVFTGPFEYDERNRAIIRAMGMSLEGRLRVALREDLGGTYSVGASPSYTFLPTARYSVSISFGSDPTRTEALTERVFAEIERLKREGPNERELADIKETLLRDYEANMRQNGYLLSNLVGRYQAGEDVASLFDMSATYGAVTASDVQAAARRYLDVSNYVIGQLFPETK
jgi:zinc protease